MSYPRLSVEDFGRQLLESGDLDPLYIALHKAELPREQLCRWLVAYWCLYHAGVASWLSERADDFWPKLHEAACNDAPAPTGGRWPRGAERRHWRGAQARRSAGTLGERGTPGELVSYLAHGDLKSRKMLSDRVLFSDLRTRVMRLRGFGPWIAFKVGDMLERLDFARVSFEEAEVFMFKDPREAAIRVWLANQRMDPRARPRDEARAVLEATAHYVEHFRDHTAPPLHDRPVGLQEVETIFCKWKSHVNGHYPLLKDTREIGEGLGEWEGVSKTAGLLRGLMPREG